MPAFVLFIVAAGTDWLDGYYARKYGQVTTLGRILDPFADKVIVCGTFIFLAAIPEYAASAPGACGRGWSWSSWARELLVTALRSFLEERGSDFSANMAGKLKMVLQCVAAGACLLCALPRAPDVDLVGVGDFALVGGGADGLLRRGLRAGGGAALAAVGVIRISRRNGGLWAPCLLSVRSETASMNAVGTRHIMPTTSVGMAPIGSWRRIMRVAAENLVVLAILAASIAIWIVVVAVVQTAAGDSLPAAAAGSLARDSRLVRPPALLCDGLCVPRRGPRPERPRRCLEPSGGA